MFTEKELSNLRKLTDSLKDNSSDVDRLIKKFISKVDWSDLVDAVLYGPSRPSLPRASVLARRQ